LVVGCASIAHGTPPGGSVGQGSKETQKQPGGAC
jgi:hypothetical protein